MKRIISLILCAVLSALMLFSCMPSGIFFGTSSDAYSSYLSWLGARVGDTSDIVLGTGDDAQAYDVDLAGFDADGYIIRRIDGKTVIFGKTATGLDRAIRDFAKHASDANYENVYGDGLPKVGKITLSGYDISEYVILIPEDATSCVKNAAENIRDYTEIACGVILSITTERGEHNIEFVEDLSVHEQGFVIETTEGQATIRHGWASGALNGAMTFLEKYEGWRYLYTATNDYLGEAGAIDYVYPSDEVVIPVGVSDSEAPALFSRDIYGGLFPTASNCWGYKIKYNGQGFGRVNRQDKACHGLSTRFWDYGDYETLDELDAIAGSGPYCFTDEYNIELIEIAVCEYVDKCLAAGQKIGKDLTCVDIANADTGAYCECKNCLALVAKEGAKSALILNYANKVAKTVAEKYSEDLYVSILAYFGTSKPPRTMVPEKNVHVSYCFYVNPGMTPSGSACGAHPFSGDGCEDGKYNNASAKEFERWCEIATIVDVWTYSEDYHATAPDNAFTTQLDSLRYLADHGCYGSFWMGSNKLNIALSQYLVIKQHWDPYITHEEMWDMVLEYCRIVYGEDCGDFVYELYRLFDEAERSVPCYLQLRAPNAMGKISVPFILENREKMIGLFDLALENAPTAALERQIKWMRCYFENVVVRGLWDEYSVGTDEQKAYLDEHYHILYECAMASGWSGYSWERRDDDLFFPAADKMDFTVPPMEYVGY